MVIIYSILNCDARVDLHEKWTETYENQETYEIEIWVRLKRTTKLKTLILPESEIVKTFEVWTLIKSTLAQFSPGEFRFKKIFSIRILIVQISIFLPRIYIICTNLNCLHLNCHNFNLLSFKCPNRNYPDLNRHRAIKSIDKGQIFRNARIYISVLFFFFHFWFSFGKRLLRGQNHRVSFFFIEKGSQFPWGFSFWFTKSQVAFALFTGLDKPCDLLALPLTIQKAAFCYFL